MHMGRDIFPYGRDISHPRHVEVMPNTLIHAVLHSPTSGDRENKRLIIKKIT